MVPFSTEIQLVTVRLHKFSSVLTARRYASAVLGVVILSVRLSVTRVLCD